MTEQQEKAMRMALEDICGAKLCEINSMSSRAEMLRLMDKAAEALRQALAQSEHEPVAWINSDQEVFFDEGKARCYSMGWIKPLYTAPPKREWVELTHEEAWSVYRTHGLSFHRPNHVEEYEWALCMRNFAKAIEAKSKEKNT
jgi:hypothetical protein